VPTLGPYRLEKWSQGTLRFAPNPLYHGPPAKLAGIEARVVPSAAERVQLFLEGEADLVDSIPDSITSQLAGQSFLVAQPTSTLLAIVFNTGKRPFQSLAIRHLFERTLQRDEVLKVMRWPHLLAMGLLPAPYSAPSPSDLSTSELQPLLFSQKAELTPSRLVMGVPPGDLAREAALNAQAQWLRSLQIKVDLATGSAKGSASSPASMVLQALESDPDRPELALGLFTSGVAENPAHWRSRSYDALVAKIAEAPDESSLKRMVAEAQARLVTEDTVVVPLVWVTRPELRREIARKLPPLSP
jgi:ABC-type transport system substrate-binding protein